MNRRELETLLLTLESTPALLARAAAWLSPDESRRRPDRGGFSFVENVWHLADLEREGYGVRILRILAEENPALLNFDGDRMARERMYQERDVERGIAAFTRAREQNLEALRRLSGSDWKRSGAQEGVGRVTLDDIPRMMTDHDRSHEADIAALLAEMRGEKPAACPHPTSAVA
jgi:DinB family protein